MSGFQRECCANATRILPKPFRDIDTTKMKPAAAQSRVSFRPSPHQRRNQYPANRPPNGAEGACQKTCFSRGPDPAPKGGMKRWIFRAAGRWRHYSIPLMIRDAKRAFHHEDSLRISQDDETSSRCVKISPAAGVSIYKNRGLIFVRDNRHRPFPAAAPQDGISGP